MTTNQPTPAPEEGDLRIVSAAAEWDIKPRATASLLSSPVEFNEQDYYSVRPGSNIPADYSKIMEMGEQFYYKSGLVRSIIDLLVEFAVDGIRLHHNDEDMNNFYKVWDAKVGLRDRAERFATDLIRSGNVVLQRFYAEIPKVEQNEWKSEAGEIRYKNEMPGTEKLKIPIRYFFYRPSTIELVGGDAAAYSKKRLYGIRLDGKTYWEMTTSLTELEKKVKRQIPESIKKAGQNNIAARIVYPLNPEDIYVASYKKDDYLQWAYPITYSIFADLIYNQKLRFAKTLALEGFNNPVRLWKLGAHKEGLMAPVEAADKLQELLLANTGGGFKDFIWDDMISMEVFYPPLEQISGIQEDKDPILTCFGIADDLVGGVKGSGGQSTNAYRIKSFVKKIETVRKIINEWLQCELNIITKNLGFDSKPIIQYKYDDLTDERVYFTLLRELADRNILSDQTLLERMGESPYVETNRVAKEDKARNSGKIPPKASPFHNPNLEEQHSMKLDEIQLNLDNAVKEKPSAPNGRPPGAKDKMPRTKRSKAAEILDAKKVYEQLYDSVVSNALPHLGLANARQLTSEHKQNIENVVNKEYASLIIGENNNIIGYNPDRYEVWSKVFADMVRDVPSPTVEQINYLKAAAYVELGV